MRAKKRKIKFDPGLCPVKKAISKVAGVEKTEISFKKREAVVTFDDAKTNIEVLTKATENAGYPSTVTH